MYLPGHSIIFWKTNHPVPLVCPEWLTFNATYPTDGVENIGGSLKWTTSAGTFAPCLV